MLEFLKEHFERQTYDKGYQNIDVLGIRGYDDSEPTWNKIMKLPISFEDKIVADLGCFHGYFSIKAVLEGASKVYGLDRSQALLDTAELISICSDADIDYQLWTGGEPTPQCDIALVLNMLHHCEDQSLTLQNINCQRAIFEINQDQVITIDKHFSIDEIVEGRSYPDREPRLIILATKR